MIGFGVSFFLIGFGVFLIYDSLKIETTYVLNRMYVSDTMSYFLKGICSIVIAFTLFYSGKYLEEVNIPSPEFVLLALFGLLGQFIMLSAHHLLTLYLGIELLSLSLVAAVALNRDSKISVEAAMKYFVLAALASGFLLYGMSMVYGATGSLELLSIYDKLISGQINNVVMVFGLVFVVSGLAFKLGAVPFHMWVPDVYHGAALPTTLLISSAPKIAAVGLIMRFLVEGFPTFSADWQKMFLILAIFSLIVGNFVAILQKNIKRMLAYSTIGHIGFICAGFASGVINESFGLTVSAYSNTIFYVITYIISVLGCFSVLLINHDGKVEKDNINDLKAIVNNNPVLAWSMVIFMFSMAGIPPTVGFYAKLVILKSLLNAGHLITAVVAVLASVVGAFYYLRIVKILIFDGYDSKSYSLSSNSIGYFPSSMISFNAFLILFFGIFPGLLMDLCYSVINNSLEF